MSVTTLKFFVKEDGSDFPICHMTEPEGSAIGECVEMIVSSPFGAVYWFDADTCLFEDEEDDADYGILRCFTHNMAPKNGSLDESRVPYPIPQDLLTKLSGKTFRIRPRQLGLNPWGKKIELTFESVPVAAPAPLPAPVPVPVPAIAPESDPVPVQKAGIKASTLIAAALKAQ